MTLNEYIESIKSVDMAGRTPIEVYEELITIKSEYYCDTNDSCLDEYYFEMDYDQVNNDIKEILKNDGWKAVWKYLHTLPEESLNDSYFIIERDHYRPVGWSDVAQLQREMLRVLQSKQSDPLEAYIKKIKDIKIDSNNPRLALFNLSNLAYEYESDTSDSSLIEYYVSHFTSKEQAEDFIPEITRSEGLEGVWKYVHLIPEDSSEDDVFYAGGDYNEGYSLQPVTLDDVVELQKALIKLLKQKKEETKNDVK